jgi:hypothetical protein
MTVVDLEAKRRERAQQKADKPSGLKLRVTAIGALEIKDYNARGRQVGVWEIDADGAEQLIDRLYRDMCAARTERYYREHPDMRPQPHKPRDPSLRKCRLTPDNTLGGSRGCGRRTGHDGPHKSGSFEWEATYPHEQFCAHTERVYGGGPLPDGVVAIECKKDIPRFVASMLGEVKAVLYVKDGRCTRCFGRVGLQEVP